MRVRLLMFATIATIATFTPASADTPQPNQRFAFPVIGTVPCGYDICPNDQVPASLGSRVCSGSLPPSVAMVTTVAAPVVPDGKKMIIELLIDPIIDWDPFICGDEGFVTGNGTHIFGETCDNSLGPDNPLPIGCGDEASAGAATGHVYRVGALNRWDLFDCLAIYRFVFV